VLVAFLIEAFCGLLGTSNIFGPFSMVLGLIWRMPAPEKASLRRLGLNIWTISDGHLSAGMMVTLPFVAARPHAHTVSGK